MMSLSPGCERTEHVGATVVGTRERDERAAQVVTAPSAEPEGLEVIVKRAAAIVRRPDGAHSRRDDQFIRLRHAAVLLGPPSSEPVIEDDCERRVNWDFTRELRLGPLLGAGSGHGQAAERLAVRVVRADPQRGGLSVPHTGDPLERVLHASIVRVLIFPAKARGCGSKRDLEEVSPALARGTKWPGAIGGRVRDPSGKPSKPVALRATDDERAAWEIAAEEHGMTLAEWARACLNEMAARPRSKRLKGKP